jgi:hypothetical protein
MSDITVASAVETTGLSKEEQGCCPEVTLSKLPSEREVGGRMGEWGGC